jgi:hypothetical protein
VLALAATDVGLVGALQGTLPTKTNRRTAGRASIDEPFKPGYPQRHVDDERAANRHPRPRSPTGSPHLWIVVWTPRKTCKTRLFRIRRAC